MSIPADMPYRLETERLILRPLGPEDAVAMFELNSDPEVMRYTGDEPFADLEAARKFLAEYPKGQYETYRVGRMAVQLKSTGEVIGWCGLKYHVDSGETDLGYRLKRAWWGQGIATEASLAHLHHAVHTMGLKRVIARAMRENQASIRVMEKCGFVFEQDTTECMDEDGFEGVQYVFIPPIS
jgi:RimJ/RimL family protein N-acetyltransferase